MESRIHAGIRTGTENRVHPAVRGIPRAAVVASRGWRFAGCCWILAVLASAGHASAAPVPLRVDDAVALARERSPELAAARAEIDIARAELLRAGYWNPYNPVIEGGAAQRRYDAGGSDVQVSASIGLELEIGGQRSIRTAAGEQAVRRAEALRQDTERAIGAAARSAFYRVLVAQRRVSLLRSMEDLTQRIGDATAARYAEGQVARLEPNLATTRAALAGQDRARAEAELQRAQRDLELQVGVNPTGTIVIDGDLSIGAPPGDLAELLAQAEARRADVRARDAELRRLDAEAQLAARSLVPNITVRATYDTETESPGAVDRLVGGRISIPIPSFDLRRAERERVAAEQARAGAERRATERSIESEVRDAYAAQTSAAAAVDVLSRNVVAPARENLRLLEAAFHEGKIDLVQFIVVQHDLFAAQLAHLDALGDYWQARIALDRAVGSTPRETNTR